MNKIIIRLTFIITAISTLTILVFVVSCDAPMTSFSSGNSMTTVRKFFPSAVKIAAINLGPRVSAYPEDAVISQIRDDSRILGYCVESKVVSRSGPFRIRVLLDNQLFVKQATVISYPWDRGRSVRRRSFTEQFAGKGPQDPIQLGKDIDAMTGATISCRVMAQGVRNSIRLLESK